MYSLRQDLNAALEMMDLASRIGLALYHRGVVSTLKSDGTPVTEADRAVESALRESLARLRPQDGVLGEEFGFAGQGPRTWIIDPIDGTSSFAKQDPDWRVQLALEVEGAVSIAVVDAPAQGIRWWAMRGFGAFESPWPAGAISMRLRVSDSDDPGSARVQGYPLDVVSQGLAGWKVSFPDSVVPYKVIRGELEAYVFQGCYAWDHAPWILLVEEAGGRFSDWEGGRSAHKAGGIFSNTRLHDELRSGLIRR
ncbi:MAG: inositol monophosphatase [Candidatus Sericytochromatia bacterium]